ncbi:hypothetical protein GPA07_11505 [Bacillus sp. ms-22]|uniref:hypothetical protein n=1 Tax=Bacillus sp. ms-22 TaxID=2683680 RepID=UPI0012F8A8E8|nr:hypothetical protein [Bacillus sp. ms-22]QGX66033.1 hypothetical protein GPA07_11505 [Bacillus sp. ms-22]
MAGRLNRKYTSNEAGRHDENLLNEWTAQRVEKTYADGKVTCPAYHGTYEVRIGKDSKLLKHQTIELDSNTQTPLHLNVISPVK